MASVTAFSDKNLVMNRNRNDKLFDEFDYKTKIIRRSDDISPNPSQPTSKRILDTEKHIRQTLHKNNFQVYISGTIPIKFNATHCDQVYYRQFVDKTDFRHPLIVLLCIKYSADEESQEELHSDFLDVPDTKSNIFVYSVNISPKADNSAVSLSLADIIRSRRFSGTDSEFQKFLFTIAYLCRHHLSTKKKTMDELYKNRIKPQLSHKAWIGLSCFSIYLLILGIFSLTQWFSPIVNFGFIPFGMIFIGLPLYYNLFASKQLIDEENWQFDNYSRPVATTILSSIKNFEIKHIFQSLYLNADSRQVQKKEGKIERIHQKKSHDEEKIKSNRKKQVKKSKYSKRHKSKGVIFSSSQVPEDCESKKRLIADFFD